MREALFIGGVLLVVLILTMVRYRRQLRAMFGIWRSLRASQQNAKFPKQETETLLVKCSRCSTWIPEERAINLGNRIFYCSTKCVEKTVS